MKPRIMKWVVGPTFCIIGATSLAKLLLYLTGAGAATNATELVLHILSVILLYILLLTICSVFNKEDIDWLTRIFKVQKTPTN